jgi:hypothetical protein
MYVRINSESEEARGPYQCHLVKKLLAHNKEGEATEVVK